MIEFPTEEELDKLNETLDSLSDDEFKRVSEKIAKAEMALSAYKHNKDHEKQESLVKKHFDTLKPIEVTVPVKIQISTGGDKKRDGSLDVRCEIANSSEVHKRAMETPEFKEWISKIEELYKSLSESEISSISNHLWSNQRMWFPSSKGLEKPYIPPHYYKFSD